MLIHLPQSALYHSVKLFVHLPEGFDNFTSHVSVANGVDKIVLPEGCSEEFVEVTARFTDHRSLPVGETMVLKELEYCREKYARRCEPEPEPEPKEEKFDEDAPVEVDEEVAQSPPVEGSDEEANLEKVEAEKHFVDAPVEAPPVDAPPVDAPPVEADEEVAQSPPDEEAEAEVDAKDYFDGGYDLGEG